MDQTSQNGAVDLNSRINNPETAAALNRLLDRIDALEQAVGSLTDAVQQAPGLMAMTGDMVDNVYRDAAKRGVDLEERALQGLHLLEKVTEPKVATQLQQLLDLADQAPGLAAMAGDTVDDLYRDAAASGVDLNQRATVGLQLLNKLTEPKMVEQLQQLLDLADQAPGLAAMAGDMVDDLYRDAAASGVDLNQRATVGLQLLNKLTEPKMVEQLQQLLDLADQAPGLVAMAVDTADTMYEYVSEAGVDPDILLQKGLTNLVRFSALMASDEFDVLLDSGILDPQTLVTVGGIGKALATSQQEPARKVSPLGMLGAMRDPDVQKALGFMMNFAKQFGKNVQS